MREQDETPRSEAHSHSPAFLRKAARLAESRGVKRGRGTRKMIRDARARAFARKESR